MWLHDALGFTGGAGGVNESGQILVNRTGEIVCRRLVLRNKIVPVIGQCFLGQLRGDGSGGGDPDDRGFAFDLVEGAEDAAAFAHVGDEDFGAAVVENIAELGRFDGTVDDDKRCGGFGDRVKRDDGFDGVIQQDRDFVLRFDAEGHQAVGQNRREAIHLAEREGLVIVDNKGLVGSPFGRYRQKVVYQTGIERFHKILSRSN